MERIIRCFLCVCNTLLFVAGVFVISQGIEQNQDYLSQTSYKNVEFAHSITIVIGILWCITGIAGFYGIIRNGPILVLNACLLGVIMLAFLLEKIIYMNSIEIYVEQEMMVAVWHMKENGYNQSDFIYSHPIGDWISSQHDNECCGVGGPFDWLNDTSTGWEGKIPTLCCKVVTDNCTDDFVERIHFDSDARKTVFEKGCGEIVYEQVVEKITGRVILSFSLLAVQFIALLCTLCVILFGSK